jgi:hypothetical protein
MLACYEEITKGLMCFRCTEIIGILMNDYVPEFGYCGEVFEKGIKFSHTVKDTNSFFAAVSLSLS